ncbi:MAG: ABC-type Fe3+ transport system protein [Myxococcaceae bacterium]|nr:ABC-type Fe3+ transport system protein [Myxococcaceae bacterium]
MSSAVLNKLVVLTLLLAALAASGCRGEISQEPPVAILRNMYFQPKYSNQAKSYFFQDQRQMRLPVEGTLAREMETSPQLGEGRTADGAGFVDSIPIAIVQRVGDMDKLVTRGQSRYGIYCVPCHDGVGTGKGMVIQRAQNQAFQPPSFHDDRLRKMTDGQFFQTISYGANNMPAYGPQLPVDDRWAIVAYVRALQVSQANSRGQQ